MMGQTERNCNGSPSKRAVRCTMFRPKHSPLS
jgi:hypothetical protein